MPEHRPTRVILVHGTWASRKPWTKPGSDMVTTLAGSGCRQVERFTWSGRNTHCARVSAAVALKEILIKYADDRVIIVAHSHGGNVALAAMRLAGSERALRPSVPAYLVALGTPFIIAARRPPEKAVLTRISTLGILIVIILAILGRISEWWALAIIWLSVLESVTYVYSRFKIKVLLKSKARSRALSVMTSYYRLSTTDASVDDPKRPAEPANVFAVGFPGDEAGALLSTTNFLGFLSGVISKALTWVLANSLWTAFMWGLIVIQIAFFAFLTAALIGIPILAWVTTENLQAALDRMMAMKNGEWRWSSNPVVELIDEVFPGRGSGLASWLSEDGGRLVASIWSATTTVIIVATVVVIFCRAIQLFESLAIGYDGVWRDRTKPVTTTASPLGAAQTIVLPVVSIPASLKHSALTSSEVAVRTVLELVQQIETSSR